MADEIDFDGYSIVNTGGISLPVTNILATGQPIMADSCVVIVSATTVDANGVIASTLPSAGSTPGKVFIIKNDHPLLPYVVSGFGEVLPGSVVYIISTGSSWLDITPSS